jgi:hypothetical protein
MNAPLVVKTQRQVPRRQKQRQGRQRKNPGKATVILARAQRAHKRPRKSGARLQKLNKQGVLGVGQTRGQSANRNSMMVSESEFVAAVTVANQPNFNVTSYGINPGNSTLFPWLSTIASRFEKYTFTRLNFIYKKEVSEFATAGQTGKVIMSVDFDASDPPPGTKQQMEDTVPHSDAMPSQSFALNLQSKDLANPATIARYVRIAGLPGGSDIKTYDVGNFNIATQGILANNEVGELHVNYTVKFEKPVLENSITAPANNQVSVFNALTQSLTTATPVNAVLATVVTNGLSIVNTAGSFVLPTGNYLCDAWFDFENAGGNNLTVCEVELTKNTVGVTIGPTAFQGPGVQSMPLSLQPQYISSNGTDSYALLVNATFGASTTTITGQVRFVAV